MGKLSVLGINEDIVKKVIDSLGIKVVSETSTDYITYCPFHRNTYTPSFNIQKSEGVWRCWNPADGKSGNLPQLVSEILGIDIISSIRTISRFVIDKPIEVNINVNAQDDEIEYFTKEDLCLIEEERDKAIEYLRSRDISEEFADHFEIGYDGAAVVMPIYDIKGRMIAITRRMLYGKPKYKDSGQKSRTLFNIQNAKGHRSVIVVEGPFDAIKVHAAGYPNVVATMMGHLSPHQVSLLRRNFESVIVFTDNDQAGRKLGQQIAQACQGMQVYFVPYLSDAKDPGELSFDEIRRCLESKKTELEIWSDHGDNNDMLKVLSSIKSNNIKDKHQGGNEDMSFLTGLQNLKRLADEQGRGESSFLKLRDGQSVTVRFLQELDESGKYYSPDRGLAITIFDHIDPDNYSVRFLCTLDEEGRCPGCERVAINKRWRRRSRLFINAWVEELKAVKVVTTGFSSKSIGGLLVEYAEDFETLCDRNYKLRRSGEGIQTSYRLLPREVTPFDFSKVSLIDLTQFATYMPYDDVVKMIENARSGSDSGEED